MANKTLKIELQGKAEDNGDIRFDELISQLRIIKETLAEVEKALSPNNQALYFYRVVAASHSSPLMLELEQVARDVTVKPKADVLDTLLDSVNRVSKGEPPLGLFPEKAMDSLQKLANQISKVTSLTLATPDIFSVLESNFNEKIEKVLGPRRYMYNNITGQLDLINLHGVEKIFYIYPKFDKRRIRCFIPEKMVTDAKQALGERVKVTGKFEYRSYGHSPYSVQVQKLQVLPSDETLPTLNDLFGVAAETDADYNIQKYIWELKDDWE